MLAASVVAVSICSGPCPGRSAAYGVLAAAVQKRMSIGIVESIGGPLGPPEGPLQAICLGIGDTDPPRQLLGTLPAPYRVVPTSNCLLSGFEDWRELDVVAVRWRSSTYAEVDFTGLGVPATILVRRHHGKWIAEIARVVAKG